MRIKHIVDENLSDYKKPALFICANSCNWKCCLEQEGGLDICQNSEWAKIDGFDIDNVCIVDRYFANKMTSAIIFGGLEPMDQAEDIISFLEYFRKKRMCEDDVVIYTGYNKNEIKKEVRDIKRFKNIVIKFGRYIPNDEKVYDKILGVELASSNQYAEEYR